MLRCVYLVSAYRLEEHHSHHFFSSPQPPFHSKRFKWHQMDEDDATDKVQSVMEAERISVSSEFQWDLAILAIHMRYIYVILMSFLLLFCLLLLIIFITIVMMRVDFNGFRALHNVLDDWRPSDATTRTGTARSTSPSWRRF